MAGCVLGCGQLEWATAEVLVPRFDRDAVNFTTAML